MFSNLRDFFSRHRRKFAVGGIFIGGTILFSRYIERTVKNLQERETKEFLERNIKRQHYENIVRTCDEMALNMEPTLMAAISAMLQTETLVSQLKLGSSNKVALWEELKIVSFSKISLMIYITSALMVTLRIQLSVVGGYMYRQNQDDYDDQIRLPSSVQDNYMKLYHFIFNDGLNKLCALIREKVRSVIGKTSLKTKLTPHDIEQIFWAIQSAVSNDERDPCKTLVNYVLPENIRAESFKTDSAIFDEMIRETHDLLESDEVIYLMKSCVSRGFSFIMNGLTGYFVEETRTKSRSARRKKNQVPDKSSKSDLTALQSDNYFLEPVDLKALSITMAKLIPIINGFLQNNFNSNDIPHNWMMLLILLDSLKIMSANVYETFSCKA